jgi:hypothetical protein
MQLYGLVMTRCSSRATMNAQNVLLQEGRSMQRMESMRWGAVVNMYDYLAALQLQVKLLPRNRSCDHKCKAAHTLSLPQYARDHTHKRLYGRFN